MLTNDRTHADAQGMTERAPGTYHADAHSTGTSVLLTGLTSDLGSALNGAYWSFILRAELEDALDTALHRAALADTPALSDTPTLSGTRPHWQR